MNTYTTVPSGEQVVQELPWRWKVQGRIFLIGGLGNMFDAWDVTLNGILVPLLSKRWSRQPAHAGWIGTASLIGMALGAFAWGTIADTIGRKRAFTATLLVLSIFTVLGVLAPDIVWFCVFRFVAGFGLGGCIPVAARARLIPPCPPTQLARIRCRFRASKRHLLRVSWAKRTTQACFPAASSARVRTRSRRSTTLMRSCKVSSVSSGAMSTASWAMIGPVSTPASAQCTVQPVTFTP